MRAVRAISAGALAASVLAASLSICPESGLRLPDVLHHRGAKPETHAHSHGCDESPKAILEAPCPCGCGEHQPASPVGKLGYALLTRPEEPCAPIDRSALAAARPVRPDAPGHPIDHVPRSA